MRLLSTSSVPFFLFNTPCGNTAGSRCFCHSRGSENLFLALVRRVMEPILSGSAQLAQGAICIFHTHSPSFSFFLLLSFIPLSQVLPRRLSTLIHFSGISSVICFHFSFTFIQFIFLSSFSFSSFRIHIVSYVFIVSLYVCEQNYV